MATKIDFYNNAYGNRVAHFQKGGIHGIVGPHMVGNDKSGWEVHFWGDKNGKFDTSKPLASASLDGGPDDLEEIADTYARRLEMGVKPDDMFRDTEQATLEAMIKLSEELKSEKR